MTEQGLINNGFSRKKEWDYGNPKKGTHRKVYVKKFESKWIKAYMVNDVCTFGLIADFSKSGFCTKHDIANVYSKMNATIKRWIYG